MLHILFTHYIYLWYHFMRLTIKIYESLLIYHIKEILLVIRFYIKLKDMNIFMISIISHLLLFIFGD